jgi:hypothetical protein
LYSSIPEGPSGVRGLSSSHRFPVTLPLNYPSSETFHSDPPFGTLIWSGIAHNLRLNGLSRKAWLTVLGQNLNLLHAPSVVCLKEAREAETHPSRGGGLESESQRPARDMRERERERGGKGERWQKEGEGGRAG